MRTFNLIACPRCSFQYTCSENFDSIAGLYDCAFLIPWLFALYCLTPLASWSQEDGGGFEAGDHLPLEWNSVSTVCPCCVKQKSSAVYERIRYHLKQGFVLSTSEFCLSRWKCISTYSTVIYVEICIPLYSDIFYCILRSRGVRALSLVT